MKKLFAATLASGLALSIPAQAQAASFVFELSGGNTGMFTLDEDEFDSSDNGSFTFENESFVFNGADVTGGIKFFTNGGLGGFDLQLSGGTEVFTGPQLFTGPTSDPSFLTGIFALSQGTTVTISEVSAAVPEPSTWALMLLGFGAVGASMRGSRKAALAKVTYA